MVYTEQLTRVIESKIRKSDSWSLCAHENYGAFNLAPDAKLEKLLYCVTISDEAIEYFKKHGYDAIVSHHPVLSWKEKLPQLIYHTALDCCEDGLNDFWKNFLGIEDARHFDDNLGWTGKIKPLSFSSLKDKIQTKLEAPIIGDLFNTQHEIGSIVICTGLGGAVNDLALKTDADCYILGQSMLPAKMTGFRNVIEIGHTLSERIGYDCIKNFIKDLPVEIDMIPLDKDICIYGETHDRLRSSR